MNLVLIDNYDSFTYNLYDYLCRLGANCTVYRNDEIPFEELEKADALVLSPGPKRPETAGALMEVVSRFCESKAILGVCLGHQALGLYFGANLEKSAIPVHGKTSMIRHTERDIFKNIENPMQVMRYHSLLLKQLPDCLEPIAFTSQNELMAIRHKTLPLFGVQFHPESIMTNMGLKMLENWIDSIEVRS
jgi:anthranilate synthase/aminodeoxychorismate synthase-like glutamine amidotransferase